MYFMLKIFIYHQEQQFTYNFVLTILKVIRRFETYFKNEFQAMVLDAGKEIYQLSCLKMS